MYLAISLPHGAPGIVKIAISNRCSGGAMFARYFADQLRGMFGTGFKNIIAMAMSTLDRVIAEISPSDLASLSRAASFSIMIAARYGETWAVASLGNGTMIATRRDGSVERKTMGMDDAIVTRYMPLVYQTYEPLVGPIKNETVEFESITLSSEYSSVEIEQG